MTIEANASTPTPAAAGDALALRHVDIAYRVRRRDQRVVRDVSFRVAPGESFGLVGESGCGKSTIALAVVRYLARNGRVSSGTIEIGGRDVLGLDRDALRRLRARTVSMVYQEPGRALNPSILVGRQVAEVYEIAGAQRKVALERAEEILTRVHISDPGRVMDRYPHQLSGGMLQRVVIAMALAAEPALLILDEPTTALDATVEAEVLDLVKGLRAEFNTSLLFISHNLAVIAKMCDRVGVLYAGELVEEGPAGEVFAEPRHPYTVGLLRSIPRRDGSAAEGAPAARAPLATIPGSLPAPGAVIEGCIFADRCGLAGDRCRTEAPPPYPVSDGRVSRCHYHDRAQTVPLGTTAELASAAAAAKAGESPDRTPLLQVRGAGKTFHMAGQTVRGLYGVDLDIAAGETVGLVGESGSGKTTLARVIMGLTEPDTGSELRLDAKPLAPKATARASGD
ncbi:MAG TPA: oligopeptide/dipeptide ABC transporter ATP-binding protein, partial [Solirubrobacteraceae bacterium]|nr:oligopeptide/dipeptide ABC transporter ATP-binding protein [Solirubrobacteraceae bacterium]